MTVTARVLVTKIGFDGHDRGSRIVETYLREAGMAEVPVLSTTATNSERVIALVDAVEAHAGALEFTVGE